MQRARKKKEEAVNKQTRQTIPSVKVFIQRARTLLFSSSGLNFEKSQNHAHINQERNWIGIAQSTDKVNSWTQQQHQTAKRQKQKIAIWQRQQMRQTTINAEKKRELNAEYRRKYTSEKRKKNVRI